MGWLSGWGYRKSHEIAGSTAGAQTDYQVKIIVHYESGTDYNDNTKSPPEGHVYVGGKSRADFQDIRFTADDGVTELDYWFENEETAEADGYGVFWVEVDSIPASPDAKTIYVYYGKSDATSISDGEATFELFDHFESFNTEDKWTDPGESTYSGYTVEDSNLVLFIGTRGKSKIFNGGKETRTQVLFELVNRAYVGRFKCQKVNEGDKYAFHNIGIGWTGDDKRRWGRNNQRTHALTDASTRIYGSGTWDGSMTPYEVRELCITSSEIKCYCDGSLIYTQTGLSLAGQRYFDIYMAVGDGNSANAWGEIYVDWVFIRKYVDPEPTHGAWGSEETPAVAYEITLTETLGLADTVVKAPSAVKAEALGLADVISKSATLSLTETLSLADTVSAVKLLVKTLTELLGLSDIVVKSLSVVKAESLGLLDTYTRTWTAHKTYGELLGLADSIQKEPSKVFPEALGLSDAVAKSPSITKSELLGLKDIYSRTWNIYRTFTENLGLLDTISTIRVLIKVLTEELELKDAFSRVLALQRTYTEILGLKDYVSKGVSLHALVEVLSLLDSIKYGKNLTVLAKLIRKLIQLEDIGGDWFE